MERQQKAADVLATARSAADWPTVSELAETYRINGRLVRRAIAEGELRAFRLDVLRVDPDSWASWLAERQR